MKQVLKEGDDERGRGAEYGSAPGVCDGAIQQRNFHEYTREQKKQTEAAAAAGM